MIIEYKEEFNKSVKKLKNNIIAIERLERLIRKLEQAKNLSEIPNVKPIVNNPTIYRIKTGDYRLFILYRNGEITILLLEYAKRNEKTYKNYN